MGAKRDWGVRITVGLAVLLAVGATALAVWLTTDDSIDTSGPSMGRTLPGHQRVDVDLDAYDGHDPQIGDIVVAQAPAGLDTESCGIDHGPGEPCAEPTEGFSETRVVKRIVAGPGDTVAFTGDGHVVRNGDVAREPYITRCRPRVCGLRDAVTVPEGHWFLAGDARDVSSDSRYWGPVPRAALDGEVRSGRDDAA